MPSITGMRTSASRRSKWLLLGDEVERLRAVGGRHDLVAVHREGARHEAAQSFFVFGDDDTRHVISSQRS
jgi:hypothetical protein